MNNIDCMLGTDPEFFLVNKKGEVVGSEKLIPKNGLKYADGEIVRDGVQVEIKPEPSYCRQVLASYIASLVGKLAQIAELKGLAISPEPGVWVSEKEMKTLSPENQVFGCSPSKNVHNSKAKIKADPTKYFFRSAGGHIHIGHREKNLRGVGNVSILYYPEQLIPIMDIVLGNTCVLLDRHESNKERRKNYGRAGEYRIQPHGLEYRTLSNFWLRHETLMSLVVGLARQAVSMASDENLRVALLKAVKMDDVTKAINENDFELAYQNFQKIKPILESINTSSNNTNPLVGVLVKEFEHFVAMGIDHWGLKFNPKNFRTRQEWGTFALTKVAADRVRSMLLKN